MEFTCRLDISALVALNAALILLKLYLKPWLSLFCPATGKFSLIADMYVLAVVLTGLTPL
jgi:hypothetical protein